MSWFQLKSSPPDPRSLSNSDNDNNRRSNNDETHIRNYNMNDDEHNNNSDEALQQRIESYLLPSYQQQYYTNNTVSLDNHHPSYRSHEKIYYNENDVDDNSFFDYHTERRKLPMLSPIETSRMKQIELQGQESSQAQELLHRSQMDNDKGHSIKNNQSVADNRRDFDNEQSNICQINDSGGTDNDNYTDHQQRQGKKKKYSRLEIIQKAQENNRIDEESTTSSPIPTRGYRIHNNDMDGNNDIHFPNDKHDKTKKSSTGVTEDDHPVLKKPRTKKNKKKVSTTMKENVSKSKKKKSTDPSQQKQQQHPLMSSSILVSQQQQPRIRSKKNRKLPSQTAYLSSNTNKNTGVVVLTKDMFAQIGECAIFNSGASDEALDSFYRAIQHSDQEYIAWTIVFCDESLTSPFLPLCKKYCTLKGPKCSNWNCVCDCQIRAVQTSTALFGAMFIVNHPSIGGKKCFVLPLGPTTDTNESDGFKRMSNWPILPFECYTTLKRRWEIFRSILLQKHVRCVTYNAVTSLMVLHCHKMHDFETVSMDLMISSTWDLRLASWILRPHSKEEDLEFDTILQGFPHIRQDVLNTIVAPHNASSQLKSLVQIKQHLECTYALYPIINKVLLDKNLNESFHEIESPLQSILAAMEYQGIGFLPNRLRKRQERLQLRINTLITSVRHIAVDPDFLLSSPQQVSRLLFDVLKIPFPSGIDVAKGKNNSSSQHNSTGTLVLEAILASGTENNPPHDIIKIILEFRTLNKLLTSFIIPLPTLAVASNNDTTTTTSSSSHRIHPMWNQTAVRTGRLSCRKPNMQQIPTSTTLGISPRDSFCASSKDMCLFACDYCQNEIRILAHMCNDPQLISLFHDPNGTDIYKQMSSAVTGKPLQDVTDKERSISKQVTLAIIYGMGIQQVSKKLKISQSEAKNLFNHFFKRFSGVRTWMNQTKDFARQHKYVMTIVGRRRYLDDIHSNDSAKRAQAERQAVNTIIQGSAADLMKLAMLKMSCRILDWKKEICCFENASMVTGIAPKLILQIHDELLFEVSTNETDVHLLKDIVVRCCAEECERDLKLKVPLKLKFHVGISWGENMKEL